jgi:hypothetical protein
MSTPLIISDPVRSGMLVQRSPVMESHLVRSTGVIDAGVMVTSAATVPITRHEFSAEFSREFA